MCAMEDLEEAQVWPKTLRFLRIPDSHWQTFVREHLYVFPPLPLVVNMAHFIHPGEAATCQPVSSLAADEPWVVALQ